MTSWSGYLFHLYWTFSLWVGSDVIFLNGMNIFIIYFNTGLFSDVNQKRKNLKKFGSLKISEKLKKSCFFIQIPSTINTMKLVLCTQRFHYKMYEKMKVPTPASKRTHLFFKAVGIWKNSSSLFCRNSYICFICWTKHGILIRAYVAN